MKNELNIVVVDDNSSTLYLLKTIIKQFCISQYKCNLSTFSNYKKLIDHVQNLKHPNEITLLILDYHVPDMNGDKFLFKLI